MLKRKTILSLLLTFALVMVGIPFPNNVKEVNATEAQPQVVEMPVEVSEEFELPFMETSAMPMGFFDLDEGTVDLIDGTAVKWIDRLNLEGEEYQFARDFYDNLIEWTDNDGVKDWLIEDQYHTGGDLVYKVVGVSETASDYDTAKDIAQEKLQKYVPYILAVLSAFDRDYSEVFWLSGSASWYSSYGGYASSTSATCEAGLYFVLERTSTGRDIRQEAYRTEAAIKAAISERDNAIKSILSETAGMSDYELLTHFNDTLTKSNEYNHIVGGLASGTASPDAWECISALRGSVGVNGPVCEGYARAFKALCDTVDIPCVLVDGYARSSTTSSGEAHMWNYVQAEDGKWYAVDVTWNDPLVRGLTGATTGLESKTWFMLGGNTVVKSMKFIDSHPVNNRVYSNSISFTNGPVLDDLKYLPIPTPAPTATPKPTATPVPTATPGPTMNPHTPNEKGYCKYCGAIANGEYALYGRSLNLSDDIGVIYYIELDRNVDKDSVSMTLTLDGSQKKVTIPLSEAIYRNLGFGRGVYGFRCSMFASEMNQGITAELKFGDEVKETYTYSVSTYCSNKKNDSTSASDQKLMDMLDSVLVYGSKSQAYLNKDTDNLVSDQVENAPALKPLENDEVEQLSSFVRNDSVEEAGYLSKVSMTLVLYSQTALRANLTFEPGYSMNDFTFEAYDVTDGNTAITGRTGFYGGKDYFEIPNITPTDLDHIYKIVIKHEGVVVRELTYSPFAYINSKKSDTTYAGLADVVISMYRYCRAAKIYAGISNN